MFNKYNSQLTVPMTPHRQRTSQPTSQWTPTSTPGLSPSSTASSSPTAPYPITPSKHTAQNPSPSKQPRKFNFDPFADDDDAPVIHYSSKNTPSLSTEHCAPPRYRPPPHFQNPTYPTPAEPDAKGLNPMAKAYIPVSKRPQPPPPLPPFAFVPGTRNIPEKYKHVHEMTEAEFEEDKRKERELRERERGIVYYNRR